MVSGKEAADVADERTPLQKPEPVSILWAPCKWTSNLVSAYSWRLLTMVSCTNHMLKGFAAGGGDSGLLGTPIDFLLKNQRVGAGMLQIYTSVALIPWILKPVLGVMSDGFPVFGYKKLPYIMATSVLGLCAAAALGTSASQMTVQVMVFCLVVVFLQVATADLLVEAKQSEHVKGASDLGPDFFLFTWLGITVGMIVAILVAGPIIQFYGPEMCYLVALPFMALVLVPTALNWLGERPLPPEERWGRCCLMFRRQPEMTSLCVAMGIVVGLVTVTTFMDLPKGWLIALCITTSCIFLGLLVFFLRPEISHPTVFWFLLQAVPPKVHGALFYFYTDGPEVFPLGPHFSPWMYATGIGLAGFLGVFAGYLSGSELFKNWSYRGVILLSVPLSCAAQLALLPVILRWTVTGENKIPDTYIVLPLEFLASMFFAWIWVPKQVMNAYMTPAGSEATALALIAGTFNLGSMVSSFLGCFVIDYFEVCADGTKDDAEAFQNLWKPYTISSLARLLVLPLLFLIPNKLQTEVLIVEEKESATHGSPARFVHSIGVRASQEAV